jgi:hypothetical protein
MANWWESEEGRRRLFTDYGLDPRGNNELGTMMQQWGARLYPIVGQELEFLSQMAPLRQQAILGLIDSMGPDAVDADIAAFGAGADENAAKASKQASMANKAQGLGDGYQEGQNAGIAGKAASEKNAYRQQQLSPAAKIQRAAMLIQAMQGAGNPQAFNMAMGLFGPIEQRHRQNQSEVGSGSAWNSIGGMLGQATGMGWNPFGRASANPTPAAPAAAGGTADMTGDYMQYPWLGF